MHQKKLNHKVIRLVKLISHCGLCSRRKAEKLINSGKVFLNDKPYKEYIIHPSLIKKISIEGKKLKIQKTRVWIFHKTVGLLCSNVNQYNKKTIFDTLPSNLPRVVSVGRLDLNSEGLLILTTNPSLSSFLENPKNMINRKYIIKVFGIFNDEKKKELEKGITIDGIKYQPLKINRITMRNNDYVFNVDLKEGKNREIRKLMKYLELSVKKLKRIEYGPFKLLNLEKNNIKELSESKLNKILRVINYKDENNFW
ncbi:MAG: pseudouridine synthase [Rickettsiales bacterium]|nr:pseudouridine synthase [Rickettsiales bacterium]